MKYLYYGFLGLFSLGFLGLIAGITLIIFVFSYYGTDLPDYKQLADYEPPVVTRLYTGDGKLMAEYAEQKRIFVPISEIPDRVKHAFVASEDKNFYTHKGLDFYAIARAMVTNISNIGSGRRPEGASTITQQVAKNFLLTNEVSYVRKIREAILAYRMEQVMSKDRLLELYLNEIYLGAGAYGVAAAALHYFDKALNDLTIAEASYLAALPKAPNNYHPIRKRDAAIQRRNYVIRQLLENEYVTPEEADIAYADELEVQLVKDDDTLDAKYFAEEVRREIRERFGQDAVYGGGMVVRTSIDARLQNAAVDALRKGLMAYDRRHGYRGGYKKIENLENWLEELKAIYRPIEMLDEWKLAVVLKNGSSEAEIGLKSGDKGKLKLEQVKWAREYRDQGYARGPAIQRVSQTVKKGDVIMVKPLKDNTYDLMQVPDVQGALIAFDPHTGRILAMQGGWKYDSSEFNRATQAKRQPGSAFKPFVYLAALDRGFTPATLVLDAPFVLEDRPGNVWKPSNYSNEYYGPTPIRVGVERSRNLMTVRLADFLGMEIVSDYAKKFGITENLEPLLANSLGSGETTLFDITSAYAILVNGGKRITPTFIDRIQNRRGETVIKHDERPCQNCGDRIQWQAQSVPKLPDIGKQVADPRTAHQMVSILKGVIERGTGIRIKSLRRPLAGKTGTTNESKDAWFIGFSPDLVVGVFAGFDEPRSMGKRETGSSIAVPIFKDFMEEALANQPAIPFRVPKGIRNVQINAETGTRAAPGDERVIWEAFLTGTEPTNDVFILDGQGISMMPAVDGGSAAEAASTGTGGLY